MMEARHGGEIYRFAKKLGTSPEYLLDCSSNVNSFAYDITRKLIHEQDINFLHYPDSSAEILSQSIANLQQISPQEILVGSGATELIWYTLQRLKTQHVLFLGPIFSEFVTACEALQIRYEIITPSDAEAFSPDKASCKAIWESKADLFILCTPNNPAGLYYENIIPLLRMVKAPRILIDNSYLDFLYGSPAYAENSYKSYEEALSPGVALFTLHSFTKFFCCPGIRLGYLCANKMQISRLKLNRPSWLVDSFALQMGEVFLNNIELYQQTLPLLQNAVSSLARELRRSKHFVAEKIFEGVSFVSAKLNEQTSSLALCEKMLQQKILIRNCDNIPGMPRGYVRIGARGQQEMERVIQALEYL